MSAEVSMVQWVVYFRPTDFPDHVVVRAWYVMRDGALRRDDRALLFPTVDAARDWFAAYHPHLIAIERLPNDDPAIVEVYL